MGRKFGFSFSWKRALGISAAKGKISRAIGIPLTKSGRQRKAGRLVGDVVSTALIAAARTSATSRPLVTTEPQPLDYQSIIVNVKLGDREIQGTIFAPNITIPGLMRKTNPKSKRVMLS